MLKYLLITIAKTDRDYSIFLNTMTNLYIFQIMI